ncbi:MAG: ATP-binding cassette domain-containing protein [Nitriliruptorales bacterium]|nr:ATP-binding cassette domain-containing protein [Nitriliruptorales bacterium]
MIEISGLNKYYAGRRGLDRVHALADVNLTVNSNEFLTVLGPSGCGKTTLLKIIAGLVPFEHGDVRIDGEAIKGPGPERSMVFQNFALMPWASVLRNVAFGLELRKVAKDERTERARDLIRMVGLEGFESRYPAELSGGMQQRVGLARALAVEPRVLLMDEPFSALDEQTRRLLQEQLIDIWEKSKTTVVFITHSMDEAVLLGDRVVLMTVRPGRVEQTLHVPLPRPRNRDMERTSEFTGITGLLWDRLRVMQEEQVETTSSIPKPQAHAVEVE